MLPAPMSNEDRILIKGAREHNLQIDELVLPKNRLVVFTGVSGSGKSSLAFDTLYAEGQRRYVESLSSYARQFLGQMEKPKVDRLSGLSPTIAIEQKTASSNPFSSCGGVPRVLHYLRVLYARAGTQHCHLCGEPVAALALDQIVDALEAQPAGARLEIAAPIAENRKGEFKDALEDLRKRGVAPRFLASSTCASTRASCRPCPRRSGTRSTSSSTASRSARRRGRA